MAQQARLQGQLSAAREQVESLETERSALQEQQEEVQQQAQQMIEHLQAQRNKAGLQQEALRLTMEELFAELDQQRGLQEDRKRLMEALEQAWAQIETLETALRAGEEAGVSYLQVQTENRELEGLLEEARAERGKQKVMLDSAVGRIRGLQNELEKAQKQIRIQTAEMDALRQEAAGQVASANIRLGEVQNELMRYREAWGVVDTMRAEAKADMREVQRLISAGAQAADRLSGRMLHILRLQPESTEQSQEDEAPLEGDLFEAVPDLPGDAPQEEE
jgi:chromosome segregation ATPase